MKKLILLVLICLSTQMVFGQTNASLRKEYVIDNEKGHTVFPIPANKTTLVYFNLTDRRSKEYRWFFELLDEKLTVVKHMEFTSSTAPYDTYYYYTYGNHCYLLLYSTSKGKYEFNDILLDDLSYKTISGDFVKGMAIQEFYVLNNTSFVSARVSRDHQIFTLDIPSGQSKQIIPKNLIDSKIVFEDAELVSNVEVAFKYKVCTKGEGCDYYILRFDANGKQLGDFYVVPKPDADREITYITISKESENSYFVTGTFSVGRAKMANGIFFSRVTNGRTDFIKYHNFLDLNNFTNYLSDRRQDKLERKKAKKEEKGEELFISYNVVIHDVEVKNGEYVFLGEFYFPTYRTETYTVMGANGTMSTRTRQVFDGYQYSHAALAGFDKQGNLSWSNTFEMWLTQKTFRVKKFIRKNFHDDKVDLIYLNGGNVKSVTFQRDRVITEENNKIELVTDDENDKIKRSYDGEIVWWFDRNYINTGRQVIKNDEKEDREDRKRTVYFVNRVSY